MIVVSVLVRRLQEGMTYEDFREAWHPDQGFGFPTRVISAVRAVDERKVITLGFSEIDEAEAQAQLARIAPQEQRRHDRINNIAEPGMTRHFYVPVAEDDFS
jgi:hypothetical protein